MKKPRSAQNKLLKKIQQLEKSLERYRTKEQELKRSIQELSVINSLNIAVARGDTLDKILNILAQETKKFFKSHGAAVYLLSPNKRTLTLLANPAITKLIRNLARTLRFKFPADLSVVLHEESFYLEIIKKKKARIVNDEKSIKRMIQEFSDSPALNKLVPKIYKFLRMKSVMCMPLIVANEPIGIVDMSRGKPFTKQDLTRFEIIGQSVTNILSLYKSLRSYDEGVAIFTEFIQSATEGFVFCDGNLNIIDVNKYLLDVFHIAKEDIVGMNLIDLNLGALESGRYDRYLEVLRTGTPVVFESVPTPPEFGDRHLGIKAFRVGDNLCMIVNDVTEQYRETLNLRDRESQLRTIIDNQTELICRFTPDKILTFVNDAYCTYFGKSKWELIGSSFMVLIKEEDRAYVEQQIDQLDIKKPVSTLEERVILPDGSIRIQQWINRAIFDEGGELIEYQSVGRDITNLRGKRKPRKRPKKKPKKKHK